MEDQGARAPVRQRASMAGGGRKRRVDESELSADEELEAQLEAQLEAELAAAEVAADPATTDPSAAAVEPVAELAKPTRHSCRQQAKRSLAAVVELERRNDEEVENEELGGTQGGAHAEVPALVQEQPAAAAGRRQSKRRRVTGLLQLAVAAIEVAAHEPVSTVAGEVTAAEEEAAAGAGPAADGVTVATAPSTDAAGAWPIIPTLPPNYLLSPTCPGPCSTFHLLPLQSCWLPD